MSARAGEMKYTGALKLIAARYRGRTMRRSYQLDWRTAFQRNWKSGFYEANARSVGVDNSIITAAQLERDRSTR